MSIIPDLPTSADRRPWRPNAAWMVHLPLLIVFVALGALVFIPVLVKRQTDLLRQETELTAAPARDLVTDLQYALAREMALLRGFLLTEDPAYLTTYRRVRAEEDRTLRALHPLAARLSPETLERLHEVEDLSARWHAAVRADGLASRERSVADRVTYLRAEQSLYDRTLLAGVRLDSAVVRANNVRIARIRQREQVEYWSMLALIAVALLAAALVGWLGHQARVLGEEAERRRRELERATEARARLMRGVTHDLKNPLGVADGYAEILEMGIRGELNPEQHTVLAGVRRSIRSVIDAVSDLLELSQAETGRLRIERVAVDAARLVRQAADEHIAAARAAGLTLDCEVPDQLPSVFADPQRVRRILDNLLSNAIKYTPPPGRIEVDARVERQGGGARPARWLAVRVRDTGPGIAAEQHEHVFEEFVRLDSTPSRQGGSGVGLAISRNVARLMNGDLTLDSAPGRGSIFTLRLPLRDDAAER